MPVLLIDAGGVPERARRSHAGVRIPRAGTAIVAIARHWRITGFRLIGIITVSLILGVTLVVCIARPVATSGNRSNSDSGAKCDRCGTVAMACGIAWSGCRKDEAEAQNRDA